MPRKPKVGIYIDVDNFTIPLNKNPEKVRKSIQFIIETSEKGGKIIESRAYGNYLDQPHWLSNLLCTFNIAMIFTPSLNGSGKNIDDQEMAKDITLLPFVRPEINRIIVVSADGHFVPAISSVRRSGREVNIICTDKPNAVLRDAANEVIVINSESQNAEMELTEKALMSDIKELVKTRGPYFDRRSLIEALKINRTNAGERIENILDQIIQLGAIRFLMSNNNGSSSPCIEIREFV